MAMRRPGHKKRDPALRRRHFVKEWREFRGLTQQELGDMVKMTGATISRIESRDHAYNQDNLEPIADALGVHVSVLLSRGPNEIERAEAAASAAKTMRDRKQAPRRRR